jgi:cell division septal protein FtsQ
MRSSTASRRNRKLKQRRPLRSVLPSPRAVGAALLRTLRSSAPSLLALLLVGAVGAGAWGTWRWMRTSSRFSLKEVIVTGNHQLSDEEISDVAGVTPGDNLFAVSTRSVEEALERHPWVRRALVSRRLPDGLEIDVEEHDAAVLVLLDRLYLADRAGTLFKQAAVASGDGAGLVVVTGLERGMWAGGAPGPAIVKQAMGILAGWRTTDGRPEIGEIHVERAGFTLVTLERATAIRLGRGTPEEIAARMARFDTLWGGLSPKERESARTIHLDSTTRPDRLSVTVAGLQE